MEEIYQKNLNLIEDIIASDIKNETVLRIEETSKSPFIYMDPKSGLIILKGRGIPEDSIEFFRPVFNFLEMKFISINSIEAHFILGYHSSSFGKPLGDLFKKLEYLYKRNINIICYWYYDELDEDILQLGEDYEKIIRVPFVMVERLR